MNNSVDDAMNKNIDTIEPYVIFARPLYSDKDKGHDFRHIERIISRLEELSEGLEPQPLLSKLFFLACFHGLAPKMSRDAKLRDQTVAFLRGLGWQLEDINASLSSLQTHLSDPRTPEERIVYDANYYEVTGAFGIAKSFTVGGARTQSYEQTIEIFKKNLEHVTFRTPFGQRIYEQRKAYARRYLEDLIREL